MYFDIPQHFPLESFREDGLFEYFERQLLFVLTEPNAKFKERGVVGHNPKTLVG